MTIQTSNVIIREAIKGDLPSIVSLWWELSCFAESLSSKPYLKDEETCKKACFANFERSLSWPNYYYIVAEYDNEIIGFMLASIADVPQKNKHFKMAVINDLIVKKEFRRNGVCKLMYGEVEAFARNNKADYIDVSTEFRNIPAINVYKILGFAENKIELRKWLY